LVTIPLVLGIAVLNREIIQLLFERGAFGKEYTQITANVLLIYALALIPVGLTNIFNLVFFSFRKGWLPFKVSIVYGTIYILAALLLIPTLSIIGLGIANLVAVLVNCGIMMYSIHTRYFRMTWNEVYQPAIKILLLGLAMAAVTLILKQGWREGWFPNLPELFRFSANVLFSLLFYLGLGYTLRLREVTYFVGKLRNAMLR